tara:strand:+ start:7617 stop:8849 length:1233 start_codon:yes stop_codon:yes gene_type:complete
MLAKPFNSSYKKCWACSNVTTNLFNLDNFPFTGRFPQKDETSLRGNLTFSMCNDCALIQLEQAYSPDDLYSEYYYYSSVNNTMRLHLTNLVADIVTKYGTKPPGRWLDIGCNDGYTLSICKAIGWETTGVDPSNVIGKYYKNIFTEHNFINDIFPSKKIPQNNQFDIITTISMFYDISNLKQFIKAIENLISDKGIWIVEMNYTKDMILNNGYDMISHEHITYYTLKTFIKLVSLHSSQLQIYNCSFSPINGGSIRIFVDKGFRPITNIVYETINSEDESGLHSLEKIKNYFNSINVHASKVNDFVKNLKNKGKTVSIYGASTRGNTNLLLSGLGQGMIDFAYEKNIDKIGRFCPGTDILIKNEKDIINDFPDYLIVMPYSFINEFLEKEKEYLKKGGKMITLVPEIKVY